MVRMRAVGVFVLSLSLLAVYVPLLAQEPCTITVRPGESIQRAIDGAPAGAVICLAEGEWEEHIRITKSLTLRGAGPGRSVVRAKEESRPVVRISPPDRVGVVVVIEGLKVTGAKGDWREGSGILVEGWARVSITGSTISGNLVGLWLGDSAQATITGSTFSENGDGISLGGSAQATITGSAFSDNGIRGVYLEGSARVTITGSTFHNNYYGICLEGSTQATITGSTFHKNADAVYHLGSGGVTITASTFSENSLGVSLAGSVRATISGNVIQGNSWGVKSSSSGEVHGQDNVMVDNEVDLVGNLPAALRRPLVEATEMEIVYPDERYPTLQHAVDALLPGGRLVLLDMAP